MFEGDCRFGSYQHWVYLLRNASLHDSDLVHDLLSLRRALEFDMELDKLDSLQEPTGRPELARAARLVATECLGRRPAYSNCATGGTVSRCFVRCRHVS
jgi:hypothetical protein